MNAIRLATKYVEKPWGRTDLPAAYPDGQGRQIGEVWFDGPDGQHPPLLVKYIFTSERLSVQVHPNDAQGQARGLPGGKSECWLILDAEPGATLGMGTLRPLDDETLRAASLDGSIEHLMDWKPVKAGDFFYIPAGTVHAIGAGVTLVEVQQNVDVTYRLYDYGRPRELHLDDGVAVSRAEPYTRAPVNIAEVDADTLLRRDEAPFTLALERWHAGSHSLDCANGPCWFVPLSGRGTIDGLAWAAGECWLVTDSATLTVTEPARGLIAQS
ncbi:mannose-6-phosphate isomerase [Sphingobium sp. B7D2B]|uniref:class I mannose-6-phosphate isomerase n=1 Tax=Sphingobium sp. B7D2B TaxID=2940583 RepID=UPI002225001B|nr:class I mannose-6-phosphate isomerase [Sphingobium sp. B7D2B]MCW2365381.1 mannose-6-phosphate isomerase [Sphingobium sp. B7D2B]